MAQAVASIGAASTSSAFWSFERIRVRRDPQIGRIPADTAGPQRAEPQVKPAGRRAAPRNQTNLLLSAAGLDETSGARLSSRILAPASDGPR